MTKCDIPDTNPLDKECPIISDDNDIIIPSCVETPTGILCPENENCSPWDLTTQPDSCFVEDVIEESLTIRAAIINVYKLLGFHEKGKLLQLTRNGLSIAGGS